MARGNQIIVSSGMSPKGHYETAIISGTPKPGQLLELVPQTALAQGQTVGLNQYRAASRTTGSKGPIIILDMDDLQGKGPTDAYVNGTPCRVYFPVAGEEFNLLLGDVAGTADVVNVGDLIGVSNAGKLIANSSYTATPFQALEPVSTALTADTLIYVKFLGDQA